MHSSQCYRFGMTGWQWALVVGIAVVAGVAGFFVGVYYVARGMFRNM